MWVSPTTIPVLFCSCCPPTIARFVVPIIVDAVKTMFGWAWTHIGVEISKVEPTLTYCDSASAIVFPPVVVDFKAASLHRLPTTILRRIGHAMSKGAYANKKSFCVTMTNPPTIVHNAQMANLGCFQAVAYGAGT